MSNKKIKFDENCTLEEIKDCVLKSPTACGLELHKCSAIDDKALLDLLPLLNPDLLTFKAKNLLFSDSGVQSLVRRCPNLQSVEFINCQNVGRNSLQLLGQFCKNLRSVSFIYEEGIEWSLVDDALSILVKFCASELLSIKFVGFHGVSDIGVNYVAECYGESLTVVDFSRCRHLTDESLQGLATYCRNLREVGFNSTNITDKGIVSLVDKCYQLTKVNFGNCQSITDYSIKILADKCVKLLYINLKNCKQITESSFSCLAERCLHLEYLIFSNTAIAKIPVLILNLQHLKQLHLEDCPNLVLSPSQIITQSIKEIMEFYKQQKLMYRLKVVFLGEQGCGKTSLVQSLKNLSSRTIVLPTEGADVTLWCPFQDPSESNIESIFQKPLSKEEKELTLELWDFSGKQVLQGAHHIFFTPGTLFVIVFDMTDRVSCESVPTFISSIQSKVPGSPVLIVGTKSDKLQGDDVQKVQRVQSLTEHAEALLTNEIKAELQMLEDLQDTIRVQERRRNLQYLQRNLCKLHSDILCTSTVSLEGLDQVCKILLTLSLDITLFPHLKHPINPGTLQLMDEIIKIREDHAVMMSWAEFQNVANKPGRYNTDLIFNEEVKFLHTVGGLLLFHDFSTKEKSQVCVNPLQLANLIAGLHIDDCKRAFRFEADHFWPKSTSQKPDPNILVEVIEEIPSQGLVRECLLPLLWQNAKLSEDQIQSVMELLMQQQLITSYWPAKNIHETLALPNFNTLSTHNRLYVPLLSLLPSNGPHLNWTNRPFKGDVQLGWRYNFISHIPPGLSHRLAAHCRSSIKNILYQHYWKYGVLVKISDIHINMRYDDTTIEILSRVAADDGDEALAVQAMWIHLAAFIIAGNNFLSQWPGAYYQIFFAPLGDFLYQGEKVESEPPFPLLQCLDLLQNSENFKFKDGRNNQELELAKAIPFPVEDKMTVTQWLKNIVGQEQQILPMRIVVPQPVATESNGSPLEEIVNNIEGVPSEPRKRSRSKGSIKWDIEEFPISNNFSEIDAQKAAASFVATVLASAMARYIELRCENDSSYSSTVKIAQMSAARATAEAAAAAQRGDAEAAVRAVINAVKAVQDAAGSMETKSHRKNSSKSTSFLKSLKPKGLFKDRFHATSSDG